MQDKTEDNKRYQRIWTVLRTLAKIPLWRAFRFTGDVVVPEASPFLLLCNHNTDLDPALIGTCFPKQMYFVASEHVFRKGLKSRLLIDLFRPISRMKGATDASAALDVIRSLRRGNNVCLFAEGNRSFNGVTGPIFPATGKLAKASGAALVTYRFEGGYLTTPRWAYTKRLGRMRGRLVNVYTAEQLKAMTPDEVNAAIARDLYEDAFERQRLEPVDYVGKRLAEGLEHALFICPQCGRIGTLKGQDDRFVCSECGLSVQYTKRGFFADGAPFETVRDWDAWQEQKLTELIQSDATDALFSDENMQLTAVNEAHEQQTLARGTLLLYRDRLVVGGRVFPLDSISDMAQIGSSTVVFTAEGMHYELRADAVHYCGRKYHMAYRLLHR